MVGGNRRSHCAVGLSLAMAAGLLLEACAPGPRDPDAALTATRGILSGTVSYRERVALPDDAVLVVRLEAVDPSTADGLVLATDTLRAAGRQVPLPFRLTYATDAVDSAGEYRLRATLTAGDGRWQWHTLSAYAALTRGAPRDSIDMQVRRTDHPERMAPQPVGRTFVFVCGDAARAAVGGDVAPRGIALEDGDTFSFTLRTGPGEIALWLPLRFGRPYLVLGQTRAASGARYEGDGVVVWTKGDEALLEVEGETFPGCLHDRRRSIWEHAKLSGVDFRAIGQEPGWHLEIRRGRSLIFVTDYGQREIVTLCPEPETDAVARRTVYHAATEAHDLTVTLELGPCADTMSGERFETSVTVELDGQVHRGCGRALH